MGEPAAPAAPKLMSRETVPANASTLGLVNGLPFQRGSTTIMGGTPAGVTAALASLNASAPVPAANNVQPRTMEPVQPIAPAIADLERHTVPPTTDPMAKPLATPMQAPTNGSATHTPLPVAPVAGATPVTHTPHPNPLQTEEMPSAAALLAMQVTPPNAAPRTAPMKVFPAEPHKVEPIEPAMDDLESTTNEQMRHLPSEHEAARERSAPHDFSKVQESISADLVAKPPVMAPAPPPRLGTATGTDHLATPATNGTAMMISTTPMPGPDELPPLTPLGLGPSAPTQVLTDSAPNFEAFKAEPPNAATALLDESSSPDLQLPTKEELDRLAVKTAPGEVPVKPGPVTPTVQPELILASEIQVRASDTPPKNEKLSESSPWLREASAIGDKTIVESSYKPPPISEVEPKDELAEKAKARAAAGGSKTTTIIIASAVVVAGLGIGLFVMRDKLFGSSTTASAKTDKSAVASTTTVAAAATTTGPVVTVAPVTATTTLPAASTPVAVASTVPPAASSPASAAVSASASASTSAKVRNTGVRPPTPPVTVVTPPPRPPGYDPGGI